MIARSAIAATQKKKKETRQDVVNHVLKNRINIQREIKDISELKEAKGSGIRNIVSEWKNIEAWASDTKQHSKIRGIWKQYSEIKHSVSRMSALKTAERAIIIDKNNRITNAKNRFRLYVIGCAYAIRSSNPDKYKTPSRYKAISAIPRKSRKGTTTTTSSSYDHNCELLDGAINDALGSVYTVFALYRQSMVDVSGLIEQLAPLVACYPSTSNSSIALLKDEMDRLTYAYRYDDCIEMITNRFDSILANSQAIYRQKVLDLEGVLACVPICRSVTTGIRYLDDVAEDYKKAVEVAKRWNQPSSKTHRMWLESTQILDAIGIATSIQRNWKGLQKEYTDKIRGMGLDSKHADELSFILGFSSDNYNTQMRSYHAIKNSIKEKLDRETKPPLIALVIKSDNTFSLENYGLQCIVRSRPKEPITVSIKPGMYNDGGGDCMGIIEQCTPDRTGWARIETSLDADYGSMSDCFVAFFRTDKGKHFTFNEDGPAYHIYMRTLLAKNGHVLHTSTSLADSLDIQTVLHDEYSRHVANLYKEDDGPIYDCRMIDVGQFNPPVSPYYGLSLTTRTTDQQKREDAVEQHVDALLVSWIKSQSRSNSPIMRVNLIAPTDTANDAKNLCEYLVWSSPKKEIFTDTIRHKDELRTGLVYVSALCQALSAYHDSMNDRLNDALSVRVDNKGHTSIQVVEELKAIPHKEVARDVGDAFPELWGILSSLYDRLLARPDIHARMITGRRYTILTIIDNADYRQGLSLLFPEEKITKDTEHSVEWFEELLKRKEKTLANVLYHVIVWVVMININRVLQLLELGFRCDSTRSSVDTLSGKGVLLRGREGQVISAQAYWEEYKKTIESNTTRITDGELITRIDKMSKIYEVKQPTTQKTLETAYAIFLSLAEVQISDVISIALQLHDDDGRAARETITKLFTDKANERIPHELMEEEDKKTTDSKEEEEDMNVIEDVAEEEEEEEEKKEGKEMKKKKKKKKKTEQEEKKKESVSYRLRSYLSAHQLWDAMYPRGKVYKEVDDDSASYMIDVPVTSDTKEQKRSEGGGGEEERREKREEEKKESKEEKMYPEEKEEEEEEKKKQPEKKKKPTTKNKILHKVNLHKERKEEQRHEETIRIRDENLHLLRTIHQSNREMKMRDETIFRLQNILRKKMEAGEFVELLRTIETEVKKADEAENQEDEEEEDREASKRSGSQAGQVTEAGSKKRRRIKEEEED
jgi:hypothetical protein